MEHGFLVAGVHDRLEGELQAAVAQRFLDLVADGDVLAVHLALLLRYPVHDEAVAPVALGLLQRRLALGHHVEGSIAELREGYTTDRDGYVGIGPVGREGVSRTAWRMRSAARAIWPCEHWPSTTPKRSMPMRPTTSLARRQRSRRWPISIRMEFADLVAHAVIDLRQLVDADDEVAAGHFRAPAVGERVLQRLAQAHLVQVAGQFVEARETLEARLVLLAGIDEAQAADHAAGTGVGRALGGPR